MDEDPLQEHATKCLRDFFVASSYTMTKMQKLKEVASQDAIQIKELKHCKTVLDHGVPDHIVLDIGVPTQEGGSLGTILFLVLVFLTQGRGSLTDLVLVV